MTEGAGPHRLVNPEQLGPAVGFSHAVVAARGRTVYLGGQTGQGPDGKLQETSLSGQFAIAVANVAAALTAAGAKPEHLVSLQIYTTDIAAYRSASAELGEAYRRHLGRHFPAMALFEVARFYDSAAKVELVGVAVVPDEANEETDGSDVAG